MRGLQDVEAENGIVIGMAASDGHSLRLAMVRAETGALGSDDVTESENAGPVMPVADGGVPRRIELVTGAESAPGDAAVAQDAGPTPAAWFEDGLPPAATTVGWVLGAVLLAGAVTFAGSRLWGTVGGVAVMRRIGGGADGGGRAHGGGADADDGNERAFRALAAEARVSADDRAALRAAAEAMGVPPATLLMSKAVLRRAMDARCEQKLAERVRVFAARRGVRLMGAQTVEG